MVSRLAEVQEPPLNVPALPSLLSAVCCGLLRSAFHGRHAQVREKAGRIVVVFSVPNVRANSVQAGLAGHGASSLTETQAVG